MTGRQLAVVALVLASAGRGASAQPPPTATTAPPPASAPPPPASAPPPPGVVPPPAATPPPSTAPTQGAIERSTLGAPSAQWSTWSIQGDLLEDLETVAGFLDPVMLEHKTWSDSDQKEVAEFLRKLGYHLVVQNRANPSGGVDAVLLLRPVTVVRYVKVDIDTPGMWARFTDPIFADTIRRRMSLRPGSQLELDQTGRAIQLRNEANRIAQYLRNDGFYDVTVEIFLGKQWGHVVELNVVVNLGEPYEIGRISTTGNTALSAEEIDAAFRHSWGCPLAVCVGTARFSRTQLNKDVDKVVELYQKRGFPGVRVSTDFDIRHSFDRVNKTVNFHVDVRERRKIDVVFEGTRYSDERLKGHLTLDEEGSYDDLEVEASAEALRRFYQAQGFFEASVVWERVRFGVFERIVYTISEGPKLEVRGIEFVGNQAFSNERLRGEIVTKPYRRVIIGAGGGYATSLQLEQDAERLQRFYHGRGYRDATVELRVARSRALLQNSAALAAAVAARIPSEGLNVQFVIAEGVLHTVEDVRFDFGDSPPRLDPGMLGAAIKQQPGRSFTIDGMNADGEALRQAYSSRGFPRATVESSAEPGRSPSSIIVTHKITPNQQARVGNIALRGNYKTADWVILDEMKLDRGDLLTVDAAEEAQANLRGSGLFSSVQIEYMGIEDPRQEYVNVLVHVEERHDNLFESLAGAGYSTDKEAFVRAGVIMANLFGTGTRFDLQGLLGQKEQSVEAKLAFPRWVMRRLFRTSFLLELSGFAQNEQRERFGTLQTLGASVAASKDYRRGALEGLLLQLRYDFRHRTRDIELVRPAGNSDDIEETPVVTRTSSIGPLVALDRRRDSKKRLNPLLPDRGFRLELRGAYGEDYLLGTTRFVKLGASGQHFIPLGARFRISNAIRYDHGIPLGGDVALPEVERFFAGGDTTVRGFEQDRLAIEVVEEELSPFGGVTQFRVIPAGGNIRFIHNLDLQMRVWENSAIFDFPIASALFLDTGIVTNSWRGVEVRDLRHSIGIALVRLIAPFGSFSIEYAIPLDPELGDNPRGRAHVNFGFLF
ncbi:MAG TPA: POTRA domain-containing protein [Kofleriaceae bacterium]|nr:POTRA domain-containing protein [Kofleriaceae bacterium]